MNTSKKKGGSVIAKAPTKRIIQYKLRNKIVRKTTIPNKILKSLLEPRKT